MSCSRLLPRDASAQPVRWPGQKENSGPPPRTAPAACSTGAADRSPDPEIEARLRELERETAIREKSAFQRGFEQAQSDAARSAAAKIEPLVRNLAASIAELSGLKAKVRGEAEHDVIRLSVAIARRILRRELTVDPDALSGVVNSALARIEAREIARVRTHPDDVAPIQKYLAEAGVPARVEVVPDAGQERGSVVFETSRGNLDASVSTQLAEIERGLTDLVWSQRR